PALKGPNIRDVRYPCAIPLLGIECLFQSIRINGLIVVGICRNHIRFFWCGTKAHLRHIAAHGLFRYVIIRVIQPMQCACNPRATVYSVVPRKYMGNLFLDLCLHLFLFARSFVEPFIVATLGHPQDFAHLHYTERVAMFVYKRKNYSWSFVAKMRAAFFMMAFSSSRSAILSSSSFSRFRCSLGVT